MAEFREAPTLVILETQPPSLKTELQRAIFFAEKRDHVLVFTLSPSTAPLGGTGTETRSEVYFRGGSIVGGTLRRRFLARATRVCTLVVT